MSFPIDMCGEVAAWAYVHVDYPLGCLCSLARVSKVWKVEAERFLFRRIHVIDNDRQVEAIVSKIKRNPQLRYDVRAINLMWDNQTPKDVPQQCWEDLEEVLGLCTALHTILWLDFGPNTDDSKDYSWIPRKCSLETRLRGFGWHGKASADVLAFVKRHPAIIEFHFIDFGVRGRHQFDDTWTTEDPSNLLPGLSILHVSDDPGSWKFCSGRPITVLRLLLAPPPIPLYYLLQTTQSLIYFSAAFQDWTGSIQFLESLANYAPTLSVLDLTVTSLEGVSYLFLLCLCRVELTDLMMR